MPDEWAVRALLGERLERLGPAADNQLRHLDYVLELPQSSERIRGKATCGGFGPPTGTRRPSGRGGWSGPATAGWSRLTGSWTRRRVRRPRWLRAGHGVDTMPLFLQAGAVVPMGPVTQHVGERPTDPLTVLVAPFQRAGRTELRLPLDGREVTIRYRARAGRHRVTVDGHPGQVLLDAPAGVELRP
jgi:hypothetical protein